MIAHSRLEDGKRTGGELVLFDASDFILADDKSVVGIGPMEGVALREFTARLLQQVTNRRQLDWHVTRTVYWRTRFLRCRP